jgi:hypothetical protein
MHALAAASTDTQMLGDIVLSGSPRVRTRVSTMAPTQFAI